LITASQLVAAACSLPNDRLHVTFIDVGPGTATLIETPGGRHILVDAGGSARKLSTALGDALPFWDRHLDLVILTQPTQAHTGALLPVLRRYHVDAVMTNGLRGTGDLDVALWAALEAGGTQTVAAQPGMRVSVGDGVTLTVLQTQTGSPPEAGDPGQPVILLLTYHDARILLTGDLTPEGEAALLSAGLPLDSTVLQVPAGGSRAVGGEAFLAAVNPQISVLSIDAGNRYGLPHPEALARLAATGAPLYRTDQAGTIRLTTDGHRLWVKTARRSEP
jgi:competence protein ComEC